MKNLRKNIRQLIASIEDESFLETVHEILQNKRQQKDGDIWNSLTTEQKAKVLASSQETHQPRKQVSHDEMRERNRKWLGK